VYIDQGTGFQAATTIDKYYGKGASVLDACYANLKAVQMQNTDTNGWRGSVAFAPNTAGAYKAGVCTTCTKAGSTTDIVFDGNGDGDAPTKCLDGDTCDITFELEAPTSGESPRTPTHRHRHRRHHTHTERERERETDRESVRECER